MRMWGTDRRFLLEEEVNDVDVTNTEVLFRFRSHNGGKEESEESDGGRLMPTEATSDSLPQTFL